MFDVFKIILLLRYGAMTSNDNKYFLCNVGDKVYTVRTRNDLKNLSTYDQSGIVFYNVFGVISHSQVSHCIDSWDKCTSNEEQQKLSDKELFLQAYKKYGQRLLSMKLRYLKQEYGSFLIPIRNIKGYQREQYTMHEMGCTREKPKLDEELLVLELVQDFGVETLDELVKAMF